MPLELDVYPTDAEAFAAAAALAAEHLRAGAERERLAVALSGGRSGRGLLLALAALGDLPWDRIEWFWADERCLPEGDAQSNVRLARESLLGPRGIRAERIHPAPLGAGDAGAVASAYATTLGARLGNTAAPVFDLVFLDVGPSGQVAALMPEGAALASPAAVAAVPVAEVRDEPRVARITLTPPVLAAARRVIVTATGDARAHPVAAAMRDAADPARLPARLVRPSARVAWVIDRAAAADLLRDAAPVAQ